jgi:hypothetical protein
VKHAVLDEDVLVGVGGNFELAVARQGVSEMCYAVSLIRCAYPYPPDSTSLVHSSPRPLEKSSKKTGQ